jgi:hypothetical protein
MSIWEDIKSGFKKVAYVFTKEYRDRVRFEEMLVQNADKIKLKDDGTDMDEVIKRLIDNGIQPEFYIDLNWGGKSPHQDFVSGLNPEQFQGDEESIVSENLNTLDSTEQGQIGIYPMMPRGYTAVRRAELREFERKLLTGSNDKNVKPKMDIER